MKELLVKERPLLVKGPLVCQIMALIKWQTRRLKDLEEINENPDVWTLESVEDGCAIFHSRGGNTSTMSLIPCPYGKVGDRLWVRENWRLCAWAWDDAQQWFEYQADGAKVARDLPEEDYEKWTDWLIKQTESIFKLPSAIWKDEEGNLVNRDEVDEAICDWDRSEQSFKPSIHMPRWASRLTLEITDIRVERLQDISEADAIAEGCESYLDGGYATEKRHYYAVDDFADLWVSINGAESWDANPYVWCLSFKVVEATP